MSLTTEAKVKQRRPGVKSHKEGLIEENPVLKTIKKTKLSTKGSK